MRSDGDRFWLLFSLVPCQHCHCHCVCPRDKIQTIFLWGEGLSRQWITWHVYLFFNLMLISWNITVYEFHVWISGPASRRQNNISLLYIFLLYNFIFQAECEQVCARHESRIHIRFQKHWRHRAANSPCFCQKKFSENKPIFSCVVEHIFKKNLPDYVNYFLYSVLCGK